MTSEEVRSILEKEIGDDWSRTNAHGCDLRRCLVQPVKGTYYDVCDPTKPLTLWLVLEEDPDEPEGYRIVYNEEKQWFGLALPDKGRQMLVGYYGSFLQTYDGM